MDIVTLALAKSYINKRINEGEIVTGATPQQAAQIEQNKTDIADLRVEIDDKQPKGDYVKTVNGNKPDVNGNVTVATDGNGSGNNLTLDTTLTQSGKAADAKAVGDALDKLEEKIPSIDGLAKVEDIPTKPEDIGAQPAGNYLTSAPVTSVNGKAGAVVLGAADVGALPDTYVPSTPTAEQVGADPTGTAASAVNAHNISTNAHNDIRQELVEINTRLTAFFDSDNQTLDELSEIVAYITSNKSLIDAITTSKVSITDIINNLTTNMTDKPLSAAQGVVIKTLIDGVSANLANYQPKGDYVKTVNGNKPDASGNVMVATGGNGSGENVGLTADQISALDGMFKVATYDASASYTTAYKAFQEAFGLSNSGGSSGEQADTTAVIEQSGYALSTTETPVAKDWACVTAPYSVDGTKNQTLKYHIPNYGGISVGSAGKMHAFRDGDYETYYTINYATSADSGEGTTLTEIRYGEYDALKFTLVEAYVDDSYLYLDDTGDILFAGKNTKYYGMNNISQAQG